MQKNVELICVGGYMEYGRNCTVLTYNGYGIMLDCGINVSELQKTNCQYKNLVPLFNLESLKSITILGVFISHAHLDHIGAIPHFLKKFDCPIYASQYTVNVCKNLGYGGHYLVMEDHSVIELKDFIITATSIQHSVPQALFYKIVVNSKSFCYASDFKIDFKPVLGLPTNLQQIKQTIGHIDVLIFDTTRAKTIEFTKSETYVKHLCEQFFINSSIDAKHLVYTCFASNIGRIKSIIDLGLSYNLDVYVVGKTFRYHLDAAKLADIYHVPHAVRLVSRDYATFFKKAFSKPSLFIVSGGNGEPNAILPRLANNSLNSSILDNACILIGGSAIPSIKWFKYRLLAEMSINKRVYYDDIHASGHGSITDILALIKVLAPKMLVPTHSDYETVGYFCNYLKQHLTTNYALNKTLLIFQNGDKKSFSQNG